MGINMRVTFIHHSSFCVELEDKVLIFDYFRGENIPGSQCKGQIPDFEKEKQIYVFSSHQHEDHFDMEIFRWAERYKNIRYILSKDIRLGDNYLKRNGIDLSIREKILFLKANTSVTMDGMEIETFLSTDEGVAFLVTYAGKSVYHAGDLHWWHWEGEEDAFNEYQEKTYKRQIDKLKGRSIDLAFVVIDYRLGDAIFLGIDYFMEHVDAKHVIPMHLWQNYRLISQYKKRSETEKFRSKIVDVTGENQVFEFFTT